MLTDNMNFLDRLINSSIGTVKHWDVRLKLLYSTIYVKFHDPKVGNSPKDRRLCGELKECVPIMARTRRFPSKKGKSNIAQRKQCLSMLSHAITYHMSQGSTVANVQGDLISIHQQEICSSEELPLTYILGLILPLSIPEVAISFYCWSLNLKVLR